MLILHNLIQLVVNIIVEGVNLSAVSVKGILHADFVMMRRKNTNLLGRMLKMLNVLNVV